MQAPTSVAASTPETNQPTPTTAPTETSAPASTPVATEPVDEEEDSAFASVTSMILLAVSLIGMTVA